MTPLKMDETFAVALRDLLVDQVQREASPNLRGARFRRWIASAIIALAAGGGGIAYATGALTSPPGEDISIGIGSPATVDGTGTQTVELGAPPAGADAIAISFTCLGAGRFTFADGAGVQCDVGSVAAMEAHPATYTLSLKPGQHSTTITATPGARWRLTATYVGVTHTAWGVNADGQTYGTINDRGTPDLVAAVATNGRSGYVYARQLIWGASGVTLTVYESDGKTPIGKFVLGGKSAETGGFG